MRFKPSGHGGQKLVRIPAVVIGNRDDVALHRCQCNIACARQTPVGAEVADPKPFMPAKYWYQSIVGVLIDHNDLKILERLGIKAG